MNICSVGAELFHADRRTDTHDEANIYFRAILRTRLKITPMWPYRCRIKMIQMYHITWRYENPNVTISG